MSIVRDEDFEAQHPQWVTDRTIDEIEKRKLIEAGMGRAWTWTQHQELDDECLRCGEKLTTPFVFWAGRTKNICLHPECAGALGAALIRDFSELKYGKEMADKTWKAWKKRHVA